MVVWAPRDSLTPAALGALADSRVLDGSAPLLHESAHVLLLPKPPYFTERSSQTSSKVDGSRICGRSGSPKAWPTCSRRWCGPLPAPSRATSTPSVALQGCIKRALSGWGPHSVARKWSSRSGGRVGQRRCSRPIGKRSRRSSTLVPSRSPGSWSGKWASVRSRRSCRRHGVTLGCSSSSASPARRGGTPRSLAAPHRPRRNARRAWTRCRRSSGWKAKRRRTYSAMSSRREDQKRGRRRQGHRLTRNVSMP